MLVSAGEALVDLLPAGDADPLGFTARLGGSPFNVALALGRLGAPAAFLGPLSSDGFGDRLAAALEASGVSTALITRVGRPTPLAVATLDAGEARYAFYDAGTAARGMTFRELPDLPETAELLHFGSMALAAEPAASTLLARAKVAGERCVISFDPNIRPGAAGSEREYRRNMEAGLALAHIVKLSREDLAWLRPGAEPEGFAQERLFAGAGLVVVTDGDRGATAFTHNIAVALPAPAVTVADTVGAGDAFTAGLLAALHARDALRTAALGRLDRDTIADALDYAIAAAALTCTRRGAEPPWRHELASA